MSQTAPQFLRLPQLTARIGLSKPTVYRLIALDKFPRPVRLGVAAVGWRVTDVAAWEAARHATNDSDYITESARKAGRTSAENRRVKAA